MPTQTLSKTHRVCFMGDSRIHAAWIGEDRALCGATGPQVSSEEVPHRCYEGICPACTRVIQSRASRTVPAENFVGTLSVNVDNAMSDASFREMVRRTLPIVIF